MQVEAPTGIAILGCDWVLAGARSPKSPTAPSRQRSGRPLGVGILDDCFAHGKQECESGSSLHGDS